MSGELSGDAKQEAAEGSESASAAMEEVTEALTDAYNRIEGDEKPEFDDVKDLLETVIAYQKVHGEQTGEDLSGYIENVSGTLNEFENMGNSFDTETVYAFTGLLEEFASAKFENSRGLYKYIGYLEGLADAADDDMDSSLYLR